MYFSSLAGYRLACWCEKRIWSRPYECANCTNATAGTYCLLQEE